MRNTQPLLPHLGEMALHSLSLTWVSLAPVAEFAAQLPPTLRWLRLAKTDLGDDGLTTLCSAFNQGQLPDLQKLGVPPNMFCVIVSMYVCVCFVSVQVCVSVCICKCVYMHVRVFLMPRRMQTWNPTTSAVQAHLHSSSCLESGGDGS